MRILIATTLLASLLFLGGCPLNSSSSNRAASFKTLVDQQFRAGRVDSETATPVEINGQQFPDSTANDPHAYDSLLAKQP